MAVLDRRTHLVTVVFLGGYLLTGITKGLIPQVSIGVVYKTQKMLLTAGWPSYLDVLRELRTIGAKRT